MKRKLTYVFLIPLMVTISVAVMTGCDSGGTDEGGPATITDLVARAANDESGVSMTVYTSSDVDSGYVILSTSSEVSAGIDAAILDTTITVQDTLTSIDTLEARDDAAGTFVDTVYVDDDTLFAYEVIDDIVIDTTTEVKWIPLNGRVQEFSITRPEWNATKVIQIYNHDKELLDGKARPDSTVGVYD